MPPELDQQELGNLSLLSRDSLKAARDIKAFDLQFPHINGWEKDYVEHIFENHKAVVKEMYEDKIIEKIFTNNKNVLTKDEFIKAI